MMIRSNLFAPLLIPFTTFASRKVSMFVTTKNSSMVLFKSATLSLTLPIVNLPDFVIRCPSI